MYIYPQVFSQKQREPIIVLISETSISSSMDPNASAHEFILNSPSALHSVYCEAKGDQADGLIDLGLSLRTLQPVANYHYPQLPAAAAGAAHSMVGIEAYGRDDDDDDGVDNVMNNWGGGESSDLYMKNNNNGQDCEEEAEVVQSKEQRWGYVKVNMDGVIVGRKVCIFEHGCYSTLALQLDDMFGRQCESGLKLFETESEFSLFYKDGDENWRSVGDVPWKQFVEGVKRLRIARKDEAYVGLHQNLTYIS